MNELTSESSPVVYATPEQLFANRSPEPLAFDYPLGDNGVTVRIEGISKQPKRKGIYAEIARYGEAVEKGKLTIIHPVTKEQYKPEREDVVSAAWCAACVVSPPMTVLQWLQYGAENSLASLYERCLVASRLISDAEAGVKDGEEAAETEFEENPPSSAGTITA